MPKIQREPKGPMPAQEQPKPGIESEMTPRPRYDAPLYRGSDKLKDKVALITGGDSGIGRAVAVLYAREGANVAIVYLREEQADAEETKRAVEKEGRTCLLLPGDVTDASFCRQAVAETVKEFGKLDILVNNAAYQEEQDRPEDISDEQFDKTFKTNVYGYFYMTKAALEHIGEGGGNRQLRFDHRLARAQGSDGLRRDEGRDPCFYQISCPKPGRAQDPGQLRRARTHLDSLHSQHQCREDSPTRCEDPDEAARTT